MMRLPLCRFRHAPVLLLLLLVAAALPFSGALAQNIFDVLQGEEESGANYMLSISGTVNQERFQNVNAVLYLGLPGHLSTNPYTLTVVGFPQANTRNSFFWNAEQGALEVFGTQMVSTIDTGRMGGRSLNHFYYLSPVLLEVPQTHREEELRQEAEKRALPTKIFINYGELKVTFTGSRLHGTIYMSGRDPIGEEFVQYRGTFVGEKTREDQPSL